jgi:precorrin-6B methylase 2
VFVGGGGLDVLAAAWDRVPPGGVLVANHAMVDRAAAAWRLLGNVVEVSLARGVAIADGVRLAPENPVFVSWGAR